MLTLYYKSTCAACREVMATLKELNIKVVMKDIAADEAAAAELREQSGKEQIPYLVDVKRGVNLCGLDDITNHLRKHYTNRSDSGCNCANCHNCNVGAGGDCDNCGQECNQVSGEKDSDGGEEKGSECESCQ